MSAPHPVATAPTLLVAALALLSGCRSALPPTSFVNPKFDFSFVQRVAVLPFENFSSDRQAGAGATRMLITELLASGAAEVVEPGEVQVAFAKLVGAQVGRASAPTSEQVVALGRALGVQAVLVGSVTQSEVLRSGAVQVPVVTLDAHLVETDTGASVWAATHTETGNSFSTRVLGVGAQPLSETTRRCVQALLETLVK